MSLVVVIFTQKVLEDVRVRIAQMLQCREGLQETWRYHHQHKIQLNYTHIIQFKSTGLVLTRRLCWILFPVRGILFPVIIMHCRSDDGSSRYWNLDFVCKSFAC